MIKFILEDLIQFCGDSPASEKRGGVDSPDVVQESWGVEITRDEIIVAGTSLVSYGSLGIPSSVIPDVTTHHRVDRL